MPTSFKIMGIGLLLFVVGLFMLQKEFRLMIWGKKAEAQIADAWVSSGIGRRSSSKVEVEYLFSDDKNQSVKGYFYIHDSADVPTNDKVTVLYLPGKPEINRPVNQSSWAPYLFFIGGIGLFIYGLWYMMKSETVLEAHRETEATLERVQRKSLGGRIRRVLGND
jgi:hypothetical protein